MVVLHSCVNNPVYNPDDSGLDEISEDLVEALDKIPSENLSVEDIILENGNNVVDFLLEYDPEFVEENPWILELYDMVDYGEEENSEVKAYSPATRVSAITGNAGIINLRNAVIGKISLCCDHFLNTQGIASTPEIKEILENSDPAQKGLWYKYGGKDWKKYSIPSPYYKNGNIVLPNPILGERKKYYGFDCSGLVYAGLNRIGLPIGIMSSSQYYTDKELRSWNNALKSLLLKMKVFPEEIKNNLKFTRTKISKNELVSKARQGDIIFWGLNNNGHMGIVVSAGASGKIAQCNGTPRPNYEEDNGTPSRGPRLIALSKAYQMTDVPEYGIIRLIADLNNTHWKLNIKCKGKDTYITSFNIEIKMEEGTEDDIPITPVQTTGHDYNGDACDVYFTGTYNPKTQILKGSVKKTYSADDTRTDGFEVMLTDDSQYNIPEYKIVSNGGCDNYLDLENMDNKNVPASARKNIKVNTSSTVLQPDDCADHNVYVY